MSDSISSDAIMIQPESSSEQVFARLFAHVTDQTLILTPNKRLARFVHQQYADYSRAKGLQVWPSVACQSLSTWQLALWEQWLMLTDAPNMLLDSTQELLIWQKVLQSHDDVVLFNLLSSAKVLSETWHTFGEMGFKSLREP